MQEVILSDNEESSYYSAQDPAPSNLTLLRQLVA